jgi:alkylation response protein AidB-like acyl-CoA dehydrogenase
VDFRVDTGPDHQAEAVRWVDGVFNDRWLTDQRNDSEVHTPEVHRLLADAGFLGAYFPAEYGGERQPVGLADAVIRELARRGIRMVAWDVTSIVAHTLLPVGAEEQKRRFVPGVIAGEIIICLGYSEPDAGSDVAAVRTTATRSGDGWVIEGGKMFTSAAHHATHVFLLARTNRDAPKHRGLTLFLVPTDSEGFECEPVHTLGNERTNATFYRAVTVSDTNRVGEVDDAWTVMRLSLALERTGDTGGATPGGTLADQFAGWAQQTIAGNGQPIFADVAVQEQLARMAIEIEVSRLFSARAAWTAAQGRTPTVEAAMLKLFRSECDQKHRYTWLDVVGEAAVLEDHERAPLAGAFSEGFRESVIGTIYGGSSEIMREIIAQHHLGLPRSRGRVKQS